MQADWRGHDVKMQRARAAVRGRPPYDQFRQCAYYPASSRSPRPALALVTPPRRHALRRQTLPERAPPHRLAPEPIRLDERLIVVRRRLRNGLRFGQGADPLTLSPLALDLGRVADPRLECLRHPRGEARRPQEPVADDAAAPARDRSCHDANGERCRRLACPSASRRTD